MGLVTNQPVTAGQSPWAPLAQPTSPPVVTVGGINAQASLSGLSPSFTGLYQVNFVVPENAPTGSAIPVAVSVDGAISNSATMALSTKPAVVYRC